MKRIFLSLSLRCFHRDTIAHISDDDTSVALNEIILQNVTSALEAGLSGIPVYASLGNHDFYPNGQTTGERDEIYIGVGKMWESWISNQAQVQRFEEGKIEGTLLVVLDNRKNSYAV